MGTVVRPLLPFVRTTAMDLDLPRPPKDPQRKWQFEIPHLLALTTCCAVVLAMARLGGLPIGGALLILLAIAGLVAALGLPGLIFARWGDQFGKPVRFGAIGGGLSCLAYLALPALGEGVLLPLWLAVGFAGSALGALAGVWYRHQADKRGAAILSNEARARRQRNTRVLLFLLLAGLAAAPYGLWFSTLPHPRDFAVSPGLRRSGVPELLAPSLMGLPTIVGCAALWTALARRLFMLRVVWVAGLVSLGMALEPGDLTLLFGTQAVAVIAVARGLRRWHTRFVEPRAGLASAWDLLVVLAAIGALDFVSQDVSRSEEASASGAVSAGLVLAALTLSVAWPVIARWRRWASGLFLLVVAALAGDCLLAILSGRGVLPSPQLGRLQWLGWLWCVIALAIATSTAAWLWLCRFAERSASAEAEPAAGGVLRSRLARIVAVGLLLALAVSPALRWRRIVDWPDAPHPVLPSPNAFDELNRIDNRLAAIDWRSLPPSADEKAVVADYLEELQEARSALVHESHVRDALSDPGIMLFPSRVVRMMQAAGEVASSDGRIDEAVQCQLDARQICRVAARGGGSIQVLYVASYTRISMGLLGRLRPALTREQRGRLVLELLVPNPWEEHLDHSFDRDRDQYLRSCTTWRQRLSYLLERPEQHRPTLMADFQRVIAESAAAERLLAAHLALDNYHDDHAAWPADMAALVPAYLPEVLVDPFGGGPLVYRRQADSFVLYSIGPDETDDGGRQGESPDDVGDIVLEQFQPPPDDLPE